jgi:hypothetical protein
MKRVLLFPVVASLTSCVLHLHVHEAPKPGTPVASQAPEATVPNDSIAGVVLDEQGDPIRARVAAVFPSGSLAVGTDDEGRFELSGLPSTDLVLHASTVDDRVSVRTQVTLGERGIELVVRPAAAVSIDLQEGEGIRCAIIRDGVRLEDFTLRPGKAQRVVVPPGEILIRIYEGDRVRSERTVRVDVGEHREVGFGALQELLRSGS